MGCTPQVFRSYEFVIGTFTILQPRLMFESTSPLLATKTGEVRFRFHVQAFTASSPAIAHHVCLA